MSLLMSRRLILAVTIFFSLSLFADARIWTDKTGRFRIEADYVSNDGANVKIKKTDGEVLTVPISRLSLGDQAFIAQQSAVSDLGSGTGSDPGPDSAANEAKEEAKKEAKEKARKLIKEAIALLDLDEHAHAKEVGQKLQEASRLDPGSIVPDFLLGLLNAVVAKSPLTAGKDFERCLKRRPKSVSVRNNLAIVKIRMKRYGDAAELFKKAIELSEGCDEIAQNIGRLLHLNGKQLMMPEAVYKKLTGMYATMAANDEIESFSERTGWLYMLPRPEDYAEADETEEEEGELAPKPEGSDVVRLSMSTVTSGGTGFVIAPNYILTNKHVVDDATNILIKHPKNRGWAIKAELVGKDYSRDLALLRCRSLDLPAVSLCYSTPPRGSDVMVLGYPQFDQIGMGLKSTRGSVVSTPSYETKNMLLVDAEINSGNSGGPIVNQSGQVVAVATAVLKPIGGTGGKYGAAIPISYARSFITRYVQSVIFFSTSSKTLPWPEVDSKVSPSTVLIFTQGGKMAPESSARISSGKSLEDRVCTACNGLGFIKKNFSRIPCSFCEKGIDKTLIRYRYVIPHTTVPGAPQRLP